MFQRRHGPGKSEDINVDLGVRKQRDKEEPDPEAVVRSLDFMLSVIGGIRGFVQGHAMI
jgi:hypothetical protein